MFKKIHITKTGNNRYLKNINKLIGGLKINLKNDAPIEIYYDGEVNKQEIPEGKGKITYTEDNKKWEYSGVFSTTTISNMTAGIFEGKNKTDITCEYFEDDTLLYTQTSNKWHNWSSFGKGKRVDNEGNIFEGTWKKDQDLPQESIKIIFANGDKYEGPFRGNTIDGHNNKPNPSEMTYRNGDKWVGPLKNGLPDGNGTYTVKNGEHREEITGEWVDGRITIEGRKFDKDQLHEHYIKKIIDKKKSLLTDHKTPGVKHKTPPHATILPNNSSVPTKIYYDGSKYFGEMKNNMRVGKGRMEYKDGSVYDGDWKIDEREGNGIMNFKNGDIYNGSWNKNKPHKYGVYTTNDGTQYTGMWNNGVREGHGEISYIDGRKYNGNWTADKRQGKGVMEYENGDRYEGIWYENKKEGKGVMEYKNGDRYEGEWNDDKKEGKGVM